MPFGGRTINVSEQYYSICEREALVVVFGLKKFRVYCLLAESFNLVTDHQTLQYPFMNGGYTRTNTQMDRVLVIMRVYHLVLTRGP